MREKCDTICDRGVLRGAKMDDYVTVAEKAARTAGRILRENIDGVRKISYKGDINLVTEMDTRSERAVVEVLRASFPGHGILAEEGTRITNESGYTWIIDPLDGTTNYAHGYPCFSVSIALVYEGEIIAGVVYDPMRDELFSAREGMGASLNGRKISVSGIDTLLKSLLSTG